MLLPKEILQQTSQYHLARYSRPAQTIYIIIVISILGFIAALPSIFIDVSIKSTGLLKAATEVSTIKAISSGYVKEVFVQENSLVKKDQLLFAVKSPLLEEKERFLQSKMKETNSFLSDAKILANNQQRVTGSQQLATSLYRQSNSDYLQKLTDRQTRFLKVKQDYDRNKKLFDQQVIAAAEFENYSFEFEKAKNEIELLKQSQLSTWQQELRNYEKEANDYQNQLAQVEKEKDNLNIRATVSGTIQNLLGVYTGSPVFSNQDLAQISPDTNLIAEAYVSPNDIGLLRTGMEARMQVSAFNYNQWGLLLGQIQEISNDIQIINNQPVFKVKCTLQQDYLKLKNGYEGKLKKGMTLQARFIVTERSLWQLLFDRVDNWVNPNIKEYTVFSP
jgi:multidrug resistance efflux pump